jgi:hypothetical protein
MMYFAIHELQLHLRTLNVFDPVAVLFAHLKKFLLESLRRLSCLNQGFARLRGYSAPIPLPKSQHAIGNEFAKIVSLIGRHFRELGEALG